jgi:hypothetical protein
VLSVYPVTVDTTQFNTEPDHVVIGAIMYNLFALNLETQSQTDAHRWAFSRSTSLKTQNVSEAAAASVIRINYPT